MARMGTAIMAAHMDNLLKMARREGGVSRLQIVSELSVTRAVACSLIEKGGLTLNRKEGRTEYFTVGTNEDAPAQAEKPEKAAKKQSMPPEVEAVAEPVSDSTGEDTVLDVVAELDAQIVETRNALRAEASKAGKALGEWATHQALVDALRERMTELAVKRMNVSS